MLHPLYLKAGAARGAAFLRSLHPEAWAFIALLALLNLHVALPGAVPPLPYRGDLVAAGEWWRVLTHPFVHVSWYHLLLDGSAFLFLHAGLAERRIARRLAMTGASAAGALLAAVFLSPEGAAMGFCGLSGAAHGLMAVAALEMAMAESGDRGLRRAGALLLAGVVAKSALEAWSGECFFSFLHFGLLGTPVAVSHAGGVLGGMVAFVASRVLASIRRAPSVQRPSSRRQRHPEDRRGARNLAARAYRKGRRPVLARP